MFRNGFTFWMRRILVTSVDLILFGRIFVEIVRAMGKQKLDEEALEYEDPNEGVAMTAMAREDSGSSEVSICNGI